MTKERFEPGELGAEKEKLEEPIYTPEGRVKKSEIAREMADKEEKYRKARFFGFLKSSELRITKGKIAAEDKVEDDPGAWNVSRTVEDAMWEALGDYPEIDLKRLKPLSTQWGNMGGGYKRCRLKGILSLSDNELRQVVISIIIDPQDKARVERVDRLKNLAKANFGDPEKF